MQIKTVQTKGTIITWFLPTGNQIFDSIQKYVFNKNIFNIRLFKVGQNVKQNNNKNNKFDWSM